MSCALLIIDVQNDFCEGGSMAVSGGAAVAASISALLGDPVNEGRWSHTIVTRDWHIDPGNHWVAADEQPDFVDTWPIHCEANTVGAAFHPAFQAQPDETFSKGQHGACFSGFEGNADSDNASLREWLAARGVDEVEIVGLATDHCVRATALDAVSVGLRTTVLLGHCAGVAPETTAAALTAMAGAGITLLD